MKREEKEHEAVKRFKHRPPTTAALALHTNSDWWGGSQGLRVKPAETPERRHMNERSECAVASRMMSLFPLPLPCLGALSFPDAIGS